MRLILFLIKQEKRYYYNGINGDIPGSEAHRDLAIMPIGFSGGTTQMTLIGQLIDVKMVYHCQLRYQIYWIKIWKKTLSRYIPNMSILVRLEMTIHDLG